MKKLYLFIPILFFGISALSQPVMKLAAKEHNFGTFKEEEGRKTFDFIVTNEGNAPLVIQNVVPSCGCTTPDWTRTPIPAGGKGKITAIYDPVGRPGIFDKTLSVYTNSKPEMVVLAIRGEVIQKEKTIADIFPYAIGGIRMENSQLAFTNVKKGEKKIRVMQVINTSGGPVKIEFEQVPLHLSIKANPATLKAGQKGIIEGTFDATKNAQWGYVTDMLRIKLNGILQENTFFYASAHLVEDFSSLSKEDLANAPVFAVESTNVDLGKIPGNTAKQAEFKFTNKGKSDLFLRNVKSTCGCTAVQQTPEGTPIKPGESSSIKATFNSGAYNGKQTKVIYVYTNDPKNSEVILMLNADVEQQVAGK
jgi:hypothetical protein